MYIRYHHYCCHQFHILYFRSKDTIMRNVSIVSHSDNFVYKEYGNDFSISKSFIMAIN